MQGQATSNKRPRRLGAIAYLPALLLAGCVGLIGGNPEDGKGTDGSETQDQPLACEGDLGASPIRRLTRAEYQNTIAVVFDVDIDTKAWLSPDENASGFADNSVAPIGTQQLDEYLAIAEEVATLVVADLPTTLTCDWSDPTCITAYYDEMATRAFRRPVTDAERGELLALHQSALASWGQQDAVRLVLETILMSPKFLYHVELGDDLDASTDEIVPLSGGELAARLSYFLWQAPPDDLLRAAAELGTLTEPEELEAQARRMLEDARGAVGIGTFFNQWLELDELDNTTKDPTMFPEWSGDLATAMLRETEAFASYVIREDDGKLETLLTASYSVVDDPLLAAVYDIEAADVGGAIELPGERAGLLAQPSWLARTAGTSEVSWVQRGKFVREKLLCGIMPPIPDFANEVESAPTDPSRVTNEKCMGCHQLMDYIGTGFDNYDAMGRFVTVDEAGDPVDASGEIIDSDVDGTFSGAKELGARLVQSDVVAECLTEHWLRYALRRNSSDDACIVEELAAEFIDSGRNVRELMVSLATRDAFRHRRAAAPAE